MAEDSPESLPNPIAAEQSVSPVKAHCLRCDCDLSRLRADARYCPRCGFDMLGSPPGTILAHLAGQNPRMAGMLGGWAHLAHIFRAPARPEASGDKCADNTSLMVQGYSNALYRLGRRYEFGGGASANPREALRCYSKSARLGNFWAMARLASDIFTRKGDATPAGNADPSEPPPGAADPPPSDAAAH